MGVWVGRFIPVPSISSETLDSSCYCLVTAKAVAKVFHLHGDSGKLAESRQAEEKFPMFSPPESFSLFRRVKTCEEL